MRNVFIFDTQEVLSLVSRTLRARGYETQLETEIDPATETKKFPLDERPGLVLVATRGVHLMSNEVGQDINNDNYEKAWAHGLNRHVNRYDDWNDIVSRINRDNESVSLLPIELFEDALKEGGRNNRWLCVDYDNENTDILSGEREVLDIFTFSGCDDPYRSLTRHMNQQNK